MRIAAYDCVTPSNPLEALPVTIMQSSARWPAALKLLGVGILLSVLLVPFVLIASDAEARAVLAGRPGESVLLGLGVAAWLGLLAWPAHRLLARLMSARVVRIEADHVHVQERGLLGDTSWSLPLVAFEGVAHHVRTSLSGTRHELILAHREPRFAVLLTVGSRIPQSEIDAACRLLGLREVAARELYRPIRAPLGRAAGIRTTSVPAT